MKVETLEYETAEAPEEVYAHLGPCIGVGAIYQRKGYLLHTQPVGWNNFSAQLAPLLDDLTKDVRDKSKLQIYIAGCSLDGEYDQEVLEGRKTVLEVITNAGFQECLRKVQGAKYYSSQTLYLILEEGVGTIEED